MELERGLKITRIAKNGGVFVFLSRETEAVFFHIAHLRGYRVNDIKEKINEDGTQISVIGLRGFGKVFRIPEGVVLDRIKAKFDEEESVLTISMPKSVKGTSGSVVEEIVAGTVSASFEKMYESHETKPTELSTGETGQVIGDPTENEDQSGRKKKGKEVNFPAVAGSAILASVVVLVQTRRKQDLNGPNI